MGVGVSVDHFPICVIGAGPTGLTTLKNFAEAGITDMVCHEAQAESGGIWVYSADPERPSVYEHAHTISSKRLSQFPDFPMPDAYPDYPSHHQILAYMRAYEAHFELSGYIRFNSRVETVTRETGGRWRIVVIRDGVRLEHTADVLVICSGHHRSPSIPDLPGTFSGEQIHSARYKSAGAFKGKRVLVVGGGNSACDIAAALGDVADHVSLSIRSPQVITPKLVMGRPLDVQFAKLHKPYFRWARDRILKLLLPILVGPYARYGLQQPRFPVLSRHPTLNTMILEQLRHGKVTPRVGIARAAGNIVGFEDGTEGEFDTIIWATGFRIEVPFLDDVLPDWGNATQVPLYLRMIPPGQAGLYFIGLIQPVGCIWVAADLQARLAAAEVAGTWQRPDDMAAQIQRDLKRDARRYKSSHRHAIQIDMHEYCGKIRGELRKSTN